jgi:hypothetical protein
LTECCNCNDLYPNNQITIDKEGEPFCPYCRDKILEKCQKCGEYSDSCVSDNHSDRYCPDCIDICFTCGDIHINDNGYCNYCRPEEIM